MTDNDAYQLDKNQIRRAFDRAADQYDDVAVLQHEIGQRMIERLELIRIQPQLIIDIGCGTGHTTLKLSQRYPQSQLITLDLSQQMLLKTRQQQSFWQRWKKPFACINGDAETLPLASNSVDLIFSNLAIQWCCDLDSAFKEFHRILKPGGLLLFSTFGPDTLKELRHCWQGIDHYNHVNAFIDMHDIGDALLRVGMSDPVMDMDMMTLTYQNAKKLMQELKAIGAHNVSAGRSRGLTGKTQLKQFYAAYEQFRNQDGRLPASYEIIYGHAWALEHPPQHHNDGEVHIPLNQITHGESKQGKH